MRSHSSTGLSRRLLMADAAVLLSGAAVSSSLLAQGAAALPEVSLSVGGGAGPAVPVDFIGLSYEAMQLEDASFFSPENAGLVRQFRAMAPRGVLRLGGNTSEFGWWKASPADAASVRAASPWQKVGEPTAATVFAITPQAVDALDGFLRATGWTCIYGLNLGYGNAVACVREATYVLNKLGPRLQYFQVGNEVDLFKGHLRDPATWTPDAYLEEWLVLARAVQAALPAAKFGMPDVASDVGWLTRIAELWPAVQDKPRVVTLSHHYYWGGPPDSPNATIEKLLAVDPKVAGKAKLTRDAARAMGDATYRMTEGNTVYRGGKPGLSDAFASALWGADYLFQLMGLGYCGVNLHGGSGHAQAVSVGGSFVGEALMKDPAAPHPKPFYTPIANQGTLAGAGVNGTLNGTYVLEPVGVGMKFAAAFAGCTMLPVTLNAGAVNATAYAAKRPDGKVIVAILNKDTTRDLSIAAPLFDTLQTLTGPSLEANEARIETGSRGLKSKRSGAVQSLVLPAHTAVLIVLA